MKSKKAILQVLCLLVLFSQHAALTHALWHAFHDDAYHGQQAEHDSAPVDPGGSAGLCDFDAVFGQLLAAGPTSDIRFCTFETPSLVLASVAPAHASTSHYRPPARGPPALL